MITSRPMVRIASAFSSARRIGAIRARSTTRASSAVAATPTSTDGTKPRCGRSSVIRNAPASSIEPCAKLTTSVALKMTTKPIAIRA
jgi:hypothetical protein